MCGIVGIIGTEAVADRLLDGLKRLEYRGYDSAGIATIDGSAIERRRASGKLKNLATELAAHPLPGEVGIAPQCYPLEVRGVGVGLAVSVGRFGSIAGPLFAGWLLASGMGPQQLLYALLPIAALCGATTVALILGRNRVAAPLAA